MNRRVAGSIALVLLALAAGPGCAGRGDPWHDARIEGQVKARLAAQKNANLTRLGVVSQEATVHLTGSVETAEQKALAEGLARDVPGVRRVVNGVEVRAAPQPR
jgi:osmotically-inducible protein OsmY